jgi:hypothetical protein
MSISARAAETIKPPKAKTVRVMCPCCETQFDPYKSGKPRSYDQHKRFFALVRAAFMHWPEDHQTQFADETECRKWLTMKAGWRDLVLRMPMRGVKVEVAVAIADQAMRAAGSYAIAVAHKNELCIWKPKEISYAAMSHLEFCTLNTAVQDTIEAETNLKCDILLPPKQQV